MADDQKEEEGVLTLEKVEKAWKFMRDQEDRFKDRLPIDPSCFVKLSK